MKSWPLSEEQVSTFSTLVSNARQEKEEENNKKRMRWTRWFKYLQCQCIQGRSWAMKYEVAFWDCDFEEVEKMIQGGTGSRLKIDADPEPWALRWLWWVLQQKSGRFAARLKDLK